ncbi:3-oxoacyl-[acyl-carrier-protein] synthase III C-terminal domain-containing protein [Streptosporangium sp. NPDC001559]|uniref:3-oxoacyl-[acyl-carrier-protein] synthase III C-terminal domain-containing protein n=1 Tax=Streptosporangium sp. NPDC001559 TaxID=3366187 RepID=UPI0036E0320D
MESFFPERVVTVEERAAQLELNPAQTHMFRRIQGLDRMHYDPDLSLHDLVLPPAREILSRTDPHSVRYLMYCQAFQGVARTASDTAQEIKHLLGLERATAFTLTQQNCAIPLSAIDMAGALLRAEATPGAQVLVVTGDKPRYRGAQLVGNTCMVADGAASCLISLDGPGAVVRSFATAAKGEYSDGMSMTAERARASAEARPHNLLEVMNEAVRRAGCTLDDLQMIIPTNPNTTYWVETIKDEELRGRFFVDNVPRYSHCLAADVFINYVTLREEKRFEPGRPAMFIGIGIGMTFSAMVFTPPPDTGVS